MEPILIVDDDAGFRGFLETVLTGEGYPVQTAGSVREATAQASRTQFALVLTDLRLPDGDGIAVLRWFRENAPEVPVVIITAFGSIQNAVDAMKLGAVDYLGKPLRSPEELRVLVRRTLEQHRIARERDVLLDEDARRFSCGTMIGQDDGMVRVLELARKVAPTGATVLITGESGTGKELLARCIHDNSPRSRRVFVPVNCAALSPTLIESELFGHERGAFTGAVGQHSGRFERAHGGTLFLDEIGELDSASQGKLLRVLQEKTLERVGGARQIQVDVRLIAATNRNLKEMVAQGRFREDLYYRLNLFPLELPPLRDRRDDIIPLARHFLSRAAKNLGKAGMRLTARAEAVLFAYGWPGNVRELENAMERMAILCEGTVDAPDLPMTEAGPVRAVTVREIERQAIEDALRRHGGNRTRAARELGISLRTLQYRLKDYEGGEAG